MIKKIFTQNNLDFEKNFLHPMQLSVLLKTFRKDLDLEKAFDTVDHTLLQNKLSYYGIRVIANRWFKS